VAGTQTKQIGADRRCGLEAVLSVVIVFLLFSERLVGDDDPGFGGNNGEGKAGLQAGLIEGRQHSVAFEGLKVTIEVLLRTEIRGQGGGGGLGLIVRW